MHSKSKNHFCALQGQIYPPFIFPEVVFIFSSSLEPTRQVQVTVRFFLVMAVEKLSRPFTRLVFVCPSSAQFEQFEPSGRGQGHGCPCSVYLCLWLSLLQGVGIAARKTSQLLTWGCHVTGDTASVYMCVCVCVTRAAADGSCAHPGNRVDCTQGSLGSK